MKPAVMLLILACLTAPPLARAGDIYMKVDPGGALILTDEPRPGYQRLGPDGAAPAAHEPIAVPRAGGQASLPFAPLIAAAATEFGLPEALLHAVIRVESNYDPAAVSPRGAIGLMQLMPATARDLGVADARDPASNIRGGARYLRWLLDRFDDDLDRALAAYNAGPGAVERHGGGTPPYAETLRYVPRVIDMFQRLSAGGGEKSF